jgi:hypothetical protein
VSELLNLSGNEGRKKASVEGAAVGFGSVVTSEVVL